MYSNRTDVETAARAGAALGFVFFWGHRPAKDGRITASCLSQWWPSPFEVDGRRYPTAEHWMMAEKARLFGDAETAAAILGAEDPKEVKRLGREARGFDPVRWTERRLDIVRDGSFHKFRQNPELGEFLLSTGERILVEASPVDPVWGIGLAGHNPDAADPLRWRGENLLGFALMHARQRLRNAG